MNHSFSLARLTASLWADFRHSLRSLIVFDLLFRLVNVWILLPSVAFLLARVMARAGYIAVSNQDAVTFLFSPLGVLYAALFGIVSTALLLFEQAGLMVLASGVRPRFGILFPEPIRLTRLAALLFALVVLLLAPFVALAWLVYHLLLSRQDINYYLAVRPAEFWLAGSLGVLLLLAALALLTLALVRWNFALPIILFEQQSPRDALRLARERVRGIQGRLALILAGWWGGFFLLSAVLAAAYRFLAESLLLRAGAKPITLILLLLLGQLVLVTLISFVTVVGHALLTRRLYLQRGEQLGLQPATQRHWETPAPAPAAWPVYLLVPALLVAPSVLWVDLPALLQTRPPVGITAHRGYSNAAPENTLSAVLKAIEVGADYAEIDVQLTADDVVVLLHDRDLKRVSGDPRRIDQITFAQARKLDVGRWFDAAFAEERLASLAEVIEKCRGRIKLNIELKLYGPGERLAHAVARLITEQRFENDCLVTSFDLPALREVERLNPKIRTGLIVATALGPRTTVSPRPA